MTARNIATLDRRDASPARGGFQALLALDQEAMDALPEAVYLCAGDGRVVRFNQKAVDLWGRTPRAGDPEERYCGSFRMHRTDGSALPHDQCPMATALRTGESFEGQEVVVERPDGERRTVLVNISALRDDDGQINGAVNLFQDISRRNQVETGLRKSEREIRDLIEALPAAIYTTDAEGRITMFNRAAAEFSGRVPELGTESWCVTWKLFRPDGTPLPHEECPMARALKEGRPIRGEEAIAERPDGSRIHFAPYPTPLRDETGQLVGAINMLVDITDRKKSEEQKMLFLREMDHRAKNFIAVAISLVTLSAQRARTTKEIATTVRDRLNALMRAHELARPGLLANGEPAGAAPTLDALIQTIVAPYVDAHCETAMPRAITNGPVLTLGPHAATGLALVLHELATNAVKYGALSKATGRLEIGWSLGEDALQLHWTEDGGPRIERAPVMEGFGSQLARMTIIGQLKGRLVTDWRRRGLALQVTIPLDKLSK